MKREPMQFCKMVIGLLPREVVLRSLTATVNVDLSAMEETQGRLAAYRYARDIINAPLLEGEIIHADEGEPHTVAWRAQDE